TSHDPEDALELRVADLEALDEEPSRLVVDLLAASRDPSRRGRAVHLEDAADLVDVQPVDEVQAQDVPVLLRQAPPRGLERGLEVGAMARANVLELRILDRRGHLEERVGRRRGALVSAPPREVERGADGGDSEPAGERPAPRIIEDLRGSSLFGDEELRA